MGPRTTRRRYLGGLALAALPAVAGCLGGDDPDDGDGSGATSATTSDRSTTARSGTTTPQAQTPTDTTTTEEPTSTDERTAGAGGDTAVPDDSPEELLQAFAEAGEADPASVRPYFHPVHPLHPENLPAEEAEQFLGSDDEAAVTGVTVERRDRAVTASAVTESPLMRLGEVDESTVAEALADADTAVLALTIARADGSETEYRVATATVEGEWRILALALPPAETDDSPAGFEGRVVSEVTYRDDPPAARAHFEQSPTADRVTARSLARGSETSTTTPDVIAFLQVRIDPTGDEVVVTATVDGDRRPIHRERSPPEERTVASVSYDDDPASDAFDAVAAVEVRDVGADERIVAESTVRGNRVSMDPSMSSATLLVGLDPDGDEVVVTRTVDGTTEEIHRERHVFRG